MAGRNCFSFIRFVFFSGILTSLLSCHVVRSVYWNVADLQDYKKFPADTLFHSQTSWVFYDSYGPVRSDSLRFDSLLEQNKTVAFLMVKNDTVIYERYFRGFSRTSTLPSFSIAKSFVSALLGIAMEEGYIRSIDQPITDFIPQLSDEGMKKVTLKNLLEMRSGLNFNEGYANPFGIVTKYYYGLNLRKYTLKLKTATEPDSLYQYQSANTQLLAMAIENATGRPLTQYFQEKIWHFIGIENDASWSYDSKKDHEVKAFCCLNASVLDFAKFGRLILNQGLWNGQEIIPSKWVKESFRIQNNSKDSEGYAYTYGWRVTPEGDFYAKGVGGQYLYVCPHHRMLILRFGSKYENMAWPPFFRKLCHPHN